MPHRARPICRHDELVIALGCCGALALASLIVALVASRHPLATGLIFLAVAAVLSILILGIPRLRLGRSRIGEPLPAPAGTHARRGVGVGLFVLVLWAALTAAVAPLGGIELIAPGVFVGAFGSLFTLVSELRLVVRWERSHGRRLLREPSGALGLFVVRAQDRYLFIDRAPLGQMTGRSRS